MDAREHWEQVYTSKAVDQVSWYEAASNPSLRFIDSCGISSDAEIIDIGSGASALIDGLLARGYRRVTALDISDAALRAAQARLGPRAALVRWVVGDVTTVALPSNHFDLWHDRAVFHFLTRPEDRAAYARLLRASVKPGGHVVVATFGPGGPPKCSGLSVMRYDAASLGRELGDGFSLAESFLHRHATPFGTEQEFLFARFRVS